MLPDIHNDIFNLTRIKRKAMKKKYIIIMTSLLAGLIIWCFFKEFSHTEIFVLEHMTEYKDGCLYQICMVKNPPASSGKLQKLIQEFNNNNPIANKNFNRLFIKGHDNIIFPALTLSKNYDYYSRNTSREDLDNIDFLGDSYSRVNKNGDTIKETEVYVGQIYYYKK